LNRFKLYRPKPRRVRITVPVVITAVLALSMLLFAAMPHHHGFLYVGRWGTPRRWITDPKEVRLYRWTALVGGLGYLTLAGWMAYPKPK
jgi:hypothetical protein